ncbi:MAG TPA: uracil-DNA glycosylase [Gammaproteobacteria bacterium]|jgi:DNA polymerase|nr:uracil-DNA glycosylase [Gammaproteobacteria bacterium]
MMLQDFYEQIKDCQNCALAASRTQVVFGDGNPHAEIMFVGEAPGFHEDRIGKPFVGAAGKLLDQLLGEIGIERRDIYIANVIKCRPPQNRNPRVEEIESCKPFLLKQIELIRPKIICTLGNFSTQLLLGRKVGITKVRGQAFERGSYVVVPMLHPAAALHRESMLQAVKGDFQNLRKILDEGVPSRSSGTKTDQLSLF